MNTEVQNIEGAQKDIEDFNAQAADSKLTREDFVHCTANYAIEGLCTHVEHLQVYTRFYNQEECVSMYVTFRTNFFPENSFSRPIRISKVFPKEKVCFDDETKTVYEKGSYGYWRELQGLPDIKGEVYPTDLSIRDLELTSLDGCPDVVIGTFNCSVNSLSNLKGGPRETGNYLCNNNFLETLEGGPNIVTGQFHCTGNKLTSLEGAPIEVHDNFDCTFNNLTSLKGCPHLIGGSFDCRKNALTSLEYCPPKTFHSFIASDCKIKDIEATPKEVGGNFEIDNNYIEAFNNLPVAVKGHFYCFGNPGYKAAYGDKTCTHYFGISKKAETTVYIRDTDTNHDFIRFISKGI